MLWIATAVLWAILIAIVVLITTSSRRFEFEGNNLRIVSYEPRSNITMVDNNGNYLNVTATNIQFDATGTFTVEYLGRSFYHTISRQSHSGIPSTRVIIPSEVGSLQDFLQPVETEPPPTERRLAEISFIQQIAGTVLSGPVSFGLAWACVIIGFFFLLLSVASFLYPRAFWEFEQAFNLRAKNAEPTEWGIIAHQLGGGIGIATTFVFAMIVLTIF